MNVRFAVYVLLTALIIFGNTVLMYVGLLLMGITLIIDGILEEDYEQIFMGIFILAILLTFWADVLEKMYNWT